MSKSIGGPAVLIVDNDLGFVWWLGDIFHEVGYRPVPAMNAQQAASLVAELNVVVSIAVVNPALPGVRKLIKALRQADNRVGIVLVHDSNDSTTVLAHALTILDRPTGVEPVSRPEWLKKLRRVLKLAERAAAPKVISYPFRKVH